MSRADRSQAPDDSAPDVLTVREAASLLRISRSAVYALVQRGDLPFIRVTPRSLRFRRSSLEAWLETRERPQRTVEERISGGSHL